jgi:polyisoprenoid-binding protein YceI
MRSFLLLATAALVCAQARGQTVDRELRPNEGSRLELRVYKTGFMKGKVHLFEFPRYSGTLHFDPLSPVNSRVKLSLEAANIELKDTWLSPKDFKSVQEYALKDMLNAAKFPSITFESTAVRAGAGGSFDVDGMLTLRGIAKPATLNVRIESAPHPKFTGTAQIRLSSYGIKPPTAGMGTVGTKDEMDFSFSVIP